MPQPRIPKLSPHKASGQGVVRLNGVDHYCGPIGAPETQAEYDRLVAEWLANGRRSALPCRSEGAGSGTTVGELIVAFWRHAENHYRHPDGRPTSELHDYKCTLKPLRELYSALPLAEFTPKKLKSVRERMILDKLCRRVVNQRVSRIKRMFKWGVAEEIVPETIFRALQAVAGLQKGRCPGVEDHPEIPPVAIDQVEAILSHVRPVVRSMIEVQLLTGMRPGEVCQLREVEIDKQGEKWTYRPTRHKTAWRGKSRAVPIGPRAREIIQGYLDTRAPDQYVFSPREAVEQQWAERRSKRTSKRQPSQANRKRKAKPIRTARDRYTSASYNRAIARGCLKAGVAVWTANQLRHARGTEVRKLYGLEAAQAVLGHERADVTQIYAERNLSLAEKVAAEIG